MRPLGEILLGFLLYFILDRIIKLFGHVVIEKWAYSWTRDDDIVRDYKLGFEIIIMTALCFIVYSRVA